MRVAFVNSTRIWSGVKTWMLEFGTELRSLGDEVSFFASDPRFCQELERLGHAAYPVRFGFDYNPATIGRFWRAFRRLRIEVACMNLQKELRSAGIAACLLGIPVIHRVGLPGDLSAKWDQRLAQRLIVDRILVTSRIMREDILRRWPFVAAHRIEAIHNGKAVTGAPHLRMNRPVRFVMTSRLEPDKRHGDLLWALKQLLEEGIGEFTVDLFGEGALRSELERRIGELGLRERVHMRGFSRDLERLLPGFDFGVLTSHYESLANAVLEYLSAGLPVIATATGGIPEMVFPEQNGYLFQAGDATALTIFLKAAVTMNDEEYARLSANAIRTIHEQFHRTAQARRLHDFCVRLAARRDSAGE
jgi:glycosyltransferase involved in cell wall biosynthesis